MLGIEGENRIRQMNPWIVDPQKGKDILDQRLPFNYVHRNIEQTPVISERAMLIVGPRQAGKSTVVWRWLRNVTPNFLFLNMEDPLLRIVCNQPLDIIEHLRTHYDFIQALFVDEIQHLEEAGLFVKGLVDAKLNKDIWVTGSSSYDLRSKTRESLAGRATRRRLLPFSLSELLKHADAVNPVAERQICKNIFAHQLIFGSYPAVYLSEEEDQKRMILNDLVEALILRDASDLFHIKRVDAFRKLLTLLAGQIGNLLNISELAALCNVDVGTVNSHIEILEESHIVKKILPFSEGKRREITSAPKVYFVDNGIRNQLRNDFKTTVDLRSDKGQLFENWAFCEIYKILPFQDAIKFWRSKSKAEVDFVLEHAGRRYGLEIKSTPMKHPKLSRSMWSFIDAYGPDGFAVLNTNLDLSVDHDKGKIDFITPFNFLSWLRNCLMT